MKQDFSGIRKAKESDVEFILSLAKEKYPARDVEKGLPWLRWAMKNPDRIVLVGDFSAGIASADWKYGFERRGRLDMLASRPNRVSPLEALKMVRVMLLWARLAGCEGSFILDADTGVDFSAFAKRLGGKLVTHTKFEIPL